MITLSFSSEKGAKTARRGARERQIRDIVDTHLAFPGSEKLKVGVNIKDNGDASISFTGPQEALAEAKRLWREHVQPAAAKVKRATVKAKRAATKRAKRVVGAAKPLRRKPARKAKAAPKPRAAKKSPKRAAARAKAKVARTTSQKRKSGRGFDK